MVLVSGFLVGATVISGVVLGAGTVLAANDSVVDDVNIEVPVACTMNGIGTDSHNATITPGTSNSAMGETTIKAYCNDDDGFAIYAIGYTNNTDGDNTLTSNNLSPVQTIATGTGTSGNSQWAMKLATVSSPTPTYPITIQNSYDSFHTVPNAYDLVAKRTTGTDVGTNAEGSTLTSTYQVYISTSQAADTYTGQVKYVLVHPNNAAPIRSDQIGVTYNGNGLKFTGGVATNQVVYGTTCTSDGYIGTTPTVVETSNLTDGVQDGAYGSNESILQPVSFTGADKVKVVVRYGFSDAFGVIIEGEWDGNSQPGNYVYVGGGDPEENPETFIKGVYEYTFDSDAVTLFMQSSDDAEPGYDYGMYALVYPIYSTEQPGTEENLICEINSNPASGTYATATPWRGKWYITTGSETTFFASEADVIDYLEQNARNLLGHNLEVNAYNPYAIVYDGNGATAGTMSGFFTALETNTASSTADLMAHNFKKTGYGFAGWSPDPNATVNSNSKIYGPNEKIAGNELTFDSNKEATLYAVWVQSTGDMQGYDCDNLNSGEVTALTDTRDSNVYTVGKMEDDGCWMMENLRLDAAYSTDSSKSAGFGGVFTGLANSEDTNWGTTNSNSRYSTSNIVGGDEEYRFPRYNNNNTNIGGTNSAGTTLIVTPGVWDGGARWTYNQNVSDHAQWYGYGNYYSWAASRANTDDLSTVSSSSNVSSSICPSGWGTPGGRAAASGRLGTDFSSLDIQLGGTGGYQKDNDGEEIVSNRWRSYPHNFVYSGIWNWEYSTADARGDAGYYWSYTAATASGAYILQFSSDVVFPGDTNSSKSHGLSVRCVKYHTNT